MLYEDLTRQIIGAYYDVYNTLGFGFLEQVYHNAMLMELRNRGLSCDSQKHIDVFYRNEVIGYYIPDIIVEDKIIVELKALPELTGEEVSQVLNYLKATGMEVGILLNFGEPTASFRRYDNHFE